MDKSRKTQTKATRQATVYVIAMPWDPYRARGAKAFKTLKSAQAHCDMHNADPHGDGTEWFVSECKLL